MSPLFRISAQGSIETGLPEGLVVRINATITPDPEPPTNEQLRQQLLGVTTGFTSGLAVNSGVNPSGRGGRKGSPDGYQFLSDAVAAQRGVPFDIMTGWQYQNKEFTVDSAGTVWNDLKGMQVLDWFDNQYPAVLGMKPFPKGGSYTDAKNGLYDAELVAIGQTIAAKRPAGTGMVWLRLGWEMNGNWYDHAAFNNDWSAKADYLAGTRQIITKIREGAGNRVKFVQCWSASANLRWQSTYWGDSYADAISADVYDAYGGTNNGIHTRAHLEATGFIAMYDFARAHNKLFGVDEWGGHGTTTGDGAASNGGDNPDFQQVMWDWFQEVKDNLLWELQFNENEAGNVENNLWTPQPIQLPNARAKHIELWSGQPPVDPEPEPAPTYSSTAQYSETNILDFSGNWLAGDADRYSTTVGSELEFTFNGTRFGLYGTRDIHHGAADVYVDGTKLGVATQTAATRSVGVLVYASETLSSGSHAVRVVTTAATIAWSAVGAQGAFTTLPVEPDPEPSTALWQSDMAQSTLANAYDFNYVNPDYAGMGSIVTGQSVPDGSTRVFRSTISAATQGYRAHNELDLVNAPDFPRQEAWYVHHFRFPNMGSLMSNQDAKVGFGLVGAPDRITSQDAISSGGNMIATSFSERMTVCRPGYINGADPGGLSAYVYAYRAGGQSFSSYGLRFPYRSNGEAIIPVQGQWYEKKVHVKVNTPGQDDGVYQVWIDGVLVLDLDDVQWVPSGQSTQIGYLWTQTFPNATLTTAASFDQSDVRVYGSDPATTPVSTYNSMILSDGPVAFYPMGEATDLAGGRTAVFTGSPTQQSLNGEGFTVFNGTSQYATVADGPMLSIPTTGELTIEAWIRPDVTTFPNVENDDYIHFLGKGEGLQDEYKFRMYNLVNSESRPNRISCYAFNLPGSTGTGSYFQDTITPGQWIHVVGVYNITAAAKQGEYPNGYCKIYKNGVLRDQDDLNSTVPVVPENGTAPLRIGTSDMESFFQGAIGKVAVYSKELSAARILAHAQAAPY